MWALDVAAALVLLAFVTLRSLEIAELFAAQWWWMVLHVAVFALAVCKRGAGRLALLAIMLGTMKAQIDSQPFVDADFSRQLSFHPQKGTVILVTGANSGIGLALVKDLAATNATLILGCRSVESCEAVKPDGDVTCLALDLADLNSVASFAKQVRQSWKRIDFLVNNAGLIASKGQRSKQGLEISFGVMHIGHFLLTRELWPLLQQQDPAGTPARVVNHASAAMTGGEFHESFFEGDGEGDLRGEIMDGCKSTLQDWFDPAQGICPLTGVYSRAKLAQVLFTVELQSRIDALRKDDSQARPITVTTLHPGTVASGIVWSNWLVRPTAMGARVLLYSMLADLRGGTYVDGMMGAHAVSLEPEKCSPETYMFSLSCSAFHAATKGDQLKYRQRLWEVSERLTQSFATQDWPF